MSHTPGPWGFEYSKANDAYEIAPVTDTNDSGLDWEHEICITANNNQANARLIEESPKMLELLQMFVDNSSCQVNQPAECEAAELLIARIKGQAD